MIIDRKLFITLEKDNMIVNNYIILNDKNYVTSFEAKNDEEAIKYFRSNKWKGDVDYVI